MIRLTIGLEIRHDEVMRVCATEDKLSLLLLHRIAVFQEIPFVSRPLVTAYIKESLLLFGLETDFRITYGSEMMQFKQVRGYHKVVTS